MTTPEPVEGVAGHLANEVRREARVNDSRDLPSIFLDLEYLIDMQDNQHPSKPRHRVCQSPRQGLEYNSTRCPPR